MAHCSGKGYAYMGCSDWHSSCCRGNQQTAATVVKHELCHTRPLLNRISIMHGMEAWSCHLCHRLESLHGEGKSGDPLWDNSMGKTIVMRFSRSCCLEYFFWGQSLWTRFEQKWYVVGVVLVLGWSLTTVCNSSIKLCSDLSHM